MKPYIESYKDFISDSYIFKLIVPASYLVDVKHPKLTVFWWMIRLSYKQLRMR